MRSERPFVRMSVQWNVPVPCIRTGRSWHKRVDSDEPVSKCARLSESSSDGGLLGSSPGSPVNLGPLTATATHQGPSRICQYLLLPLTDRAGVHSALNIETGEELVCKVSPFPISGLPRVLSIVSEVSDIWHCPARSHANNKSACKHFLILFFKRMAYARCSQALELQLAV